MEDIILHENVTQYDMALIVAVLSGFYIVVSLTLDPERLGWPASRPRRLSLLVHKRVFSPFHVPLSFFCETMRETDQDDFQAISPGQRQGCEAGLGLEFFAENFLLQTSQFGSSLRRPQ